MNKMFITDLDGTLFTHEETISEKNIETLINLKEKNIVRAIATGRSLYSARQILENDFPIDYLIFSSGAGIINWKTQKLIYDAHLSVEDSMHIAKYLHTLKIDFMIHHTIPDNHYFDYFHLPESNQDFLNRLNLYHDSANLKDYSSFKGIKAAQFLALVPKCNNNNQKFGVEVYEKVKSFLSEYNVIRTTSPLNHTDIWIEIFPKQVSKGFGVKHLADKLKLDYSNIACIGNDYNDLDMLNEFSHSYIVNNAPQELKDSFTVVPNCQDNGFAHAVYHWLEINKKDLYETF